MKKLFIFLTMLVLGIVSSWGEQTVTVATSTGTFYNDGTTAITPSSSNQFAKKWVSTASPTLTITCGSNDMVINSSDATDTKFRLHSDTYTLTVEDGYYITSYSITAYATNGSSKINDITVGTSSDAATTVSLTNLVANKAVFTISGTANPWMYIKSFTVTLAPIPTYDGNHTSYDILYSTGTFSRTDGKTSESSNNTWESSTLSGLRYTSNYNSMGKTTVNSTDYTCFHSGNSPTYTITAPSGYLIAGYSMSVWGESDQYLQPTGYSKATISTSSSDPTKIYVTNINAQTTTMQRTTGSKWAYILSFKVYLIPTYSVSFTIVDGDATVSGGNAVHVKGSSPDISKTVGANSGSSYNNPYCTYSYYSDESCTTPISQITSTCTVYAKVVSTSAPVEFASSVDDVDAQWYTLKLRDYQFYVDGETVELSSTDITSASAQWVFTGSVYNAYVYNKDAAKYLVMSGGALALSDTPQPWILAPHQSGAGFYLYDANDYKFPFRSSDGSLKYSTGPFYETANAASFVPTEVADDYSEEIIANVQPFFTTGVGAYFGLKTTIKEEYEDDVTTAATSCDAEEYSRLLAIVSDPSNHVYPTSGYYRIQNYSTEAYMGKTGSAPTIEFANTDAASVLYLTRSGEEGSYKYTISIQGANYKSAKNQATGNYALTVVAPGRFTMNDFGSDNAVFGYLYASGTTLSQDDLKGDASCWTLEDAISFSAAITNANDNTGTGHSYATLCVPFAISSITGASAYAPTKDGNYLVMGNALESTIAAGTPVMLVGATNAGSYTANIEANTAPVSSPIDTYALKGTFTGTSIDCTKQTGTNYVLGFDRDNDNRIGFYHVNSSSYSLKANRAYLNLTGGDARGYNIMFDVDDDATGIVSTPGETEEGTTIYNLSGQRLNKMQKGINIVNGKKVLF